jgi:hypothetical protein
MCGMSGIFAFWQGKTVFYAGSVLALAVATEKATDKDSSALVLDRNKKPF